MDNKKNIIIIILILVFGLVFVPRIIDRVKNDDVSRSESRSLKLDNFEKNIDPLPYLLVNNERKKVPDFKFINQNEKLVSILVILMVSSSPFTLPSPSISLKDCLKM